MKWEKVYERKQLQNLLLKVELNKRGRIVMGPVKIKHSFYKERVQSLLDSLLYIREVMQECGINTSDRGKIADKF